MTAAAADRGVTERVIRQTTETCVEEAEVAPEETAGQRNCAKAGVSNAEKEVTFEKTAPKTEAEEAGTAEVATVTPTAGTLAAAREAEVDLDLTAELVVVDASPLT